MKDIESIHHFKKSFTITKAKYDREKGLALVGFIPASEITELDVKSLKRFKIDEKLIGEITFYDSRHMTLAQKKLIFSLIDKINKHYASAFDYQNREDIYESLKRSFSEYYYDDEWKLFSTKSASVNEARSFLGYLINFIYENQIQLPSRLVAILDDDDLIEKCMYSALKNKTCAITGEKYDSKNPHAHHGIHLHHIDTVGSGRDRNKIDDSKLKKIMLRADLHNECHAIGWKEFSKKYKVKGIRFNQDEEWNGNYAGVVVDEEDLKKM